MRTIVLISIVMMTFTSCAFLDRRQGGPSVQSGALVRDVPYQARGSQTVGLRNRILVLPFLDEKIQRDDKVLRAARYEVLRLLNQTDRYVIIRNEDFPQDLSKFINENREYDMERLSPIATSMGIAAVIEGKILEIKARRMGDSVGLIREIKAQVDASVRLRVVAARNGKTLLEDVRQASEMASTTQFAQSGFSDRFLEEDPHLVQMAVRKAFSGTVGRIVQSIQKLAWEGRVAMVSGDRIYVNAGRLSGIQVGDILRIAEEGEEVFDPDTGRFIGRAPGRMKGTVEVVSYFGKDGAIATVHSGSGFQENDKVQLY